MVDRELATLPGINPSLCLYDILYQVSTLCPVIDYLVPRSLDNDDRVPSNQLLQLYSATPRK